MKNKISFTVMGRNEQGEPAEVKLKVVRPSAADVQGARRAHAKASAEGVRDNLLVRDQVEIQLRKNGVWTAEHDVELLRVVKVLVDGEAVLKDPDASPEAGRKAAVDMANAREDYLGLMSIKNLYDAATVEAFADEAEADYLVAACTYWAEGKSERYRYFGSPEGFLERKGDPDGREAAAKFRELMQPDEPAEPAYTPEYKYLLDNAFINDEGRYIDREGRFVDSEGELIEGYSEQEAVESGE